MGSGQPLGAALLAIALTVGFAPAVVQAQPTPASSERLESYTFAFQNADIAQVVQEVLGDADLPFTIDPSVTGKISFRIEQRLTKDQLAAALEAALSANGVAMVRNGAQIVITPQAKAKSVAGIRQGAQATNAPGYEIVAVPLNYSQPTEVARALEAISDSNAVLYANDKLSLLLLGGSGPQLKAALDTLKIFDQSVFQDSKIRWFELTQGQATTVASELQQIVQGAGLVGVSVVPLKRLNGIILFSRSTDALAEISKWVLRLDTPSKDTSSTLWVYHPRNSTADNLARTLNGLLGSTGAQNASGLLPVASAATPSSPTSTPIAPMVSSAPGPTGGEDEVRVSVDKESNALLIFASPARWVHVQRILNEIDKAQRQVLIQASIIEVTLGKQFQFGLDWSAFGRDLQVSAINNNSGTVAPSYPGLSITFINNDIAAAVRALGATTAIEVVSAPKIITLDNRTARLQIGDQVPVVTQSAQSTSTANAAIINSVDYRNTGVILTVTPRILGDDKLLLEITQEISNVARTSTSGIDSPTIQQRRFESALAMQSGSTVALGGLISTTRSKSSTGIPGFKDIPGVGALFRSSGSDNSRSELIILLSSTIISDAPSLQRAQTDLLSDMLELQVRGLLPTAQQ